MHQVLYRKWRPKTFSEVSGQEHITSVLSYEVEHDKTSHAYLFHGSRGTGKTTCAKLLSRAVNCENSHQGEPCGLCASCIGIDNGTITDVLEIDAASNNGIDDIRAIRDEVVYSPAIAKYRVYIIDEVHMLSTPAFNALLKTLEEPPPQVMFILATTELHKLPATIISRCRRFDFRRISQNDIVNRLFFIAEYENISIEPDAAILIARAAQGGMRDAISLLELCASEDHRVNTAQVRAVAGITGRETAAFITSAVKAGDLDNIFTSIADIYNSSKDITVFWQELVTFYRDMLVVKSIEEAESYLDLTSEEYKITMAVASGFTREMLLWHCSLLDDAYVSMQRNIVSKRLCAEFTLIRMTQKPDDSLKAIAARVATLEDVVSNSALRLNQQDLNSTENQKQSVPQSKIIPEKLHDKKTYRAVAYWIEIVKKFEKSDISNGSFLNNSKAYKTDQTGLFIIRLPNKLAMTMLEKSSAKEKLISLIQIYDNINDIIFETEDKNENKSIIDEIDTDFNTGVE